MNWSRHIFGDAAAMLTLLVLLVMSTGLQPMSPSITDPSVDACGVTCPCDAEPTDHDVAGDTHDCGPLAAQTDGDCGKDAPCEDDCPDGCPDCKCCPGFIAAVMPEAVQPLTGQAGALPPLEKKVCAPHGACNGIFRPPRSLT